MNALRWKSIAYAAAIFVVGGGTGACLALGLIRHPRGGPPRSAEMAQRMRETLRTELDLTPVQTKKIDPLVEKLGAEMRAIHIETMERVRKLIDSAHDQIAAELTPEQKRKLEAMGTPQVHARAAPIPVSPARIETRWRARPAASAGTATRPETRRPHRTAPASARRVGNPCGGGCCAGIERPGSFCRLHEAT